MPQWNSATPDLFDEQSILSVSTPYLASKRHIKDHNKMANEL